jgi:HEAT repeat protein
MDVRTRCVCALLVGCCALSLAGCAEGPFNGGGTWNPWLRKEWEKDERRGPTFHTQRKALKELADTAPHMTPERQEQVAQEMLERYRNEPNPLLRQSIVKVVGHVNGSTVDETLRAAIKDDHSQVRISAAKALGNRGNEDALKLLAAAMVDEGDLDVRIAVAGELKHFKNSQEATRALASALEDNDAALQHQAIVSLEQVTGRSYGMSVPAWRDYLAGGNPATSPAPSVAERVKGWVWK